MAETIDTLFMLEPKASNQMPDAVVLAKKEAAVRLCANATLHALTYGGKPWRCALIPHTEIAVNITLDALVKRWYHPPIHQKNKI